MKAAVVTLASGRARHIERQAHAVARMDPSPSGYFVVDLDAAPRAVAGASVLRRPVPPGAPLPLAAARNAAITAAASAGADLVVCLDADCLPARDLLAPLVAAARRTSGLLAGPVGRLGPLPAGRDAPDAQELAAARAATLRGPRPVPPPGQVVCEPRVELFWSLAFAVTPADHERIGGFDESYTGYGAEDTDYAFAARENGLGLSWVGGAWSHHQHHAISSPPREHIADIVANAAHFRARWGCWPMEGWLAAFADEGLITWEPCGTHLALTPRPTPRAVTPRRGA